MFEHMGTKCSENQTGESRIKHQLTKQIKIDTAYVIESYQNQSLSASLTDTTAKRSSNPTLAGKTNSMHAYKTSIQHWNPTLTIQT